MAITTPLIILLVIATLVIFTAIPFIFPAIFLFTIPCLITAITISITIAAIISITTSITDAPVLQSFGFLGGYVHIDIYFQMDILHCS